MKIEKLRSKKINISDISTKEDNKIGLLFSFLLLFEIISLGLNSLVNEYIFYGSIYDTLFLYAILALLFLMSCIRIIKRINAKVILFVLVTLILVLTNLLVHDTANLAKPKELIYLFWGIFVMIPIGATLYDFDSIYYWFSRLYWIAILFGMMHLFFQMNTNIVSIGGLWMSDMTSGYAILPATLFAIDYAFHKRIAWIWAAFGFATTLLFGSRGPVLIILVFLIISLVRYSNNLKRKITMVMITIAGFVFYASGLFIQTLKYLSYIIGKSNIHIATFVKILEYKDFSNGRNELYSMTIDAIWNKPIFGNGIFFDRGFASYTHNIFLEIFLDFGIIIGFLILIWMIIMFFGLFKRTIVARDSSKLTFTILLICCIIGKLLLSSSYIHEPFFFVLLGMLLCSKNSKEARISIKEGEMLKK